MKRLPIDGAFSLPRRALVRCIFLCRRRVRFRAGLRSCSSRVSVLFTISEAATWSI